MRIAAARMRHDEDAGAEEPLGLLAAEDGAFCAGEHPVSADADEDDRLGPVTRELPRKSGTTAFDILLREPGDARAHALAQVHDADAAIQ